MKTFTLFWLTGASEVITGHDISDAVRRDGYGGGAMKALDFYANGDDKSYIWDKEKRTWTKDLNLEK